MIRPRLYRYTEAQKPWGKRKEEIMQLARRQFGIVLQTRTPRPWSWGEKQFNRDVERLIKEGLLKRQRDHARSHSKFRKQSGKCVTRIVAAHPVPDLLESEVRTPYAKRKAAMAEFREVNGLE